MPQETMLFDGALAHSETDIHLEQTASFIGWDMLVLGRQARAENFVQGSYHNQFKLWRKNKLLVADTLYFEGGDRWLSSCLGMNNQAVMASFWAVPLKNSVLHFIQSNILNSSVNSLCVWMFP